MSWSDDFSKSLDEFMGQLDEAGMLNHKCPGTASVTHHEKLLATAIGIGLAVQNHDDFKAIQGILTLANTIKKEDVQFGKDVLKKVADACPVCGPVITKHNVFDLYPFVERKPKKDDEPLPDDPWPKGDSFAA